MRGRERNTGSYPVSEQDSDTSSINLLISILLRYPEIINVGFEPDVKRLRFRLVVSRGVGREEFEAFRAKLLGSLEAYLCLRGEPGPPDAGVLRFACMGYTILQVECGLRLLSKEAISLIVEFTGEFFKEHLVVEREDEVPEEERQAQDDMIENLLIDARDAHHSRNLIGFREDGRVVVFNRPLSNRR